MVGFFKVYIVQKSKKNSIKPMVRKTRFLFMCYIIGKFLKFMTWFWKTNQVGDPTPLTSVHTLSMPFLVFVIKITSLAGVVVTIPLQFRPCILLGSLDSLHKREIRKSPLQITRGPIVGSKHKRNPWYSGKCNDTLRKTAYSVCGWWGGGGLSPTWIDFQN